MGWCGLNSTKSFDEIFRDEFGTYLYNGTIRRYIEVHVDPPYESDISDEAEFFLAVNRVNYTGCDVILFKRGIDGKSVFYKIMPDTDAPCTVSKCPKMILDTLSPINRYNIPGYAEEWRNNQI